ncbi:MAG: 2-oxo acid dehydrogenase subunit E2 [Phycisphaerae bacterium]|jgi:pyruvate dehydrogenase E2 component (dihydrolipoamide acetyltransferase)|nr:2-oxo acid dehydrogenase subunit E2 [Phycisphaerae bacterium]
MMEFKLPDLGEGVHEGQVLAVHVVEGQSIKEDAPLLEVETDKAAVEIPSPCTGTVSAIHVKEKQLVHVGDVMITFCIETKQEVTPKAPTQTGVSKVRSSPSVRKLARELGIDITTLEGSDSSGRVTRKDVENADSKPIVIEATPITTTRPIVQSTLTLETQIEGVQEQTEFGIVIRQPMSQARKAISRAMSHAWETIPHVTDCNDADITDIDKMRRDFKDPDQPNLKLTLLPFVLKAICRSLQRFPILNAAVCPDSGDVLFRQYVNIGIGIDSERGLIAPVIRDADRMSIGEISAQLEQITLNARSASFSIADTKGATYTVSNAGAVGRTRYSTPIIQQNTVACLAVGRARLMPWVVEGAVVPRLILPLSHSIDHRLIDGGREIPFIEHLINDLEHPMRFAV